MEHTFFKRDIDVKFADFICGLAPDSPGIREAVELASAAVGHSHVCLDLMAELGPDKGRAVMEALLGSPVACRPGDPHPKPLVVDADGRLYLYRYWKYEHELAENVRSLLASPGEVSETLLADGIERLFGQLTPGETDWQRVAAAVAVRNYFSVISGGPGTGKTTTVVSIIALLLEQVTKHGTKLRVALAAPTGKAAARLKGSIAGARDRLVEQTEIAAQIPHEVSTVHRMLGWISNSSRFRHDRDNPLPYEVVVIDEASMVPLPMMAKLVDALAPGARLILLGDRDQLASVEAGAVLGDMCDSGRDPGFSAGLVSYLQKVVKGAPLVDRRADASPMADAIVVLQKNYRFGDNSAIGRASRLINTGSGTEALEVIRNGGSQLAMEETPGWGEIRTCLDKYVLDGYRTYLEKQTPAEALAAFDGFRILCALRNGYCGVAGVNRAVEECLADHGLIKPCQRWYRGRPVMVTVNDYALKLYNGDIGITLEDEDIPGQMAVYFTDENGGVRKLSPHRLPDHETVYAMTVHKSQGSEFSKVMMVLPPEDSQALSRELIYTGLTRAKESVMIWCNEELFLKSVERRTSRRSGLRQALWS